MTAQTSYSIQQRVAVAGLLYEGYTARDIVSKAVEGADIPFGFVVGRGTGSEQVSLGVGAGFMGISVRSLEREGAQGSGIVAFTETSTVPVLRQGYIWANCVAGCTQGDAVKFTDATGALSSGAPAAGETAISGASWESTAAAGELAILRIGV